MKKNNRIGFTLIEILFVIGVIMAMSVIKVRDINEDNESMQAKFLSQQIKTVADATNAFLVIKYNELSNLSSSGVTCNSSNSTCSLPLSVLSNNALLPYNFSNNTVLGNPYEIQLKRTGSSPNYMISGVILTKGYKSTENSSSPVFLGKVIKDIGRDGGINRISGKITGTANGWSADSTTFPILSNKKGYIGSSVGVLSGAYYVYLRRDGTLPMTGDLNLDSNNIKNVGNLTASGTISTNGNISAGGNLSVSGNTSVNGTINSNQRITGKELYSNSETYTNNWFRTMGDGGIYFQKYGGGWNMTDSNTITAYGGKNIQTTAGLYSGYVKSTGNIDANGTLNSGNVNTGSVLASGNIQGANVIANGRITAGEFVQINGTATVGASCSPSGLQGKDSTGKLLSCVNGIWKSPSSPMSRIFIRVNNSCFVPNGDTGGCSCPGGITGQYAYLSGTVIAQYNDMQCSGGQNDHCTDHYRTIYACSS